MYLVILRTIIHFPDSSHSLHFTCTFCSFMPVLGNFFFSHLDFTYKSIREINQIYYLFNRNQLEGWLFRLQANFSLWHDLLISVSVLLGLLLIITLHIYEPVIPHDFLIKIICFHPLRKQQRRQKLLYFGQCMFFLLTLSVNFLIADGVSMPLL